MTKSPSSKMQIAEKIEIKLASQNKMVNSTGTNIVTNEFNREDYVINKKDTAISITSLQSSKQNILTPGTGISIVNDVISCNNSSSYTYVVDSNQKLADWANNVTGNDYSIVGFKTGTYSLQSGKQIDLSATNTKAVYGNNATITTYIAPSQQYVIGISSINFNTSFEPIIYDLNITANENSSPTISYQAMFYKIPRMNGCKVILSVGVTLGQYASLCYFQCSRLNNCVAQVVCTVDNTTQQIVGFSHSEQLSNCLSIANYSGHNYAWSGFYGCVNLTNCIAYNIYTQSSNSKAFGFNYCLGVIHCQGNGYNGFKYCSGVLDCCKSATCGSSVFASGYCMSIRLSDRWTYSHQSTYACANTANGGFNLTT